MLSGGLKGWERCVLNGRDDTAKAGLARFGVVPKHDAGCRTLILRRAMAAGDADYF
jgi:hypothetical protein